MTEKFCRIAAYITFVRTKDNGKSSVHVGSLRESKCLFDRKLSPLTTQFSTAVGAGKVLILFSWPYTAEISNEKLFYLEHVSMC